MVFKLNLTGNYFLKMIATVIAFIILVKEKKTTPEHNELFRFKEDTEHELSVIITKMAGGNFIFGFA